MGWEMLPPEQPVWVSRCCPDECVKERDELRRRCESYKSAYDAILADLKIMEKKLSDLEAERDRLEAEAEHYRKTLTGKVSRELYLESIEEQKKEILRLEAEVERFKAALEKVYTLSNQGKDYSAFKIAKQALSGGR